VEVLERGLLQLQGQAAAALVPAAPCQHLSQELALLLGNLSAAAAAAATKQRTNNKYLKVHIMCCLQERGYHTVSFQPAAVGVTAGPLGQNPAQ
jgi:phage terminase large subunit GpA-like protein